MALSNDTPASKFVIIMIICIVISQAVALGAGYNSDMILRIPFVNWLALLAMAVQWIAFIPAALYVTEKYYDLTGSITYLVLIVASLFHKLLLPPVTDTLEGLDIDKRKLVCSAMAAVWALRLGSFLYSRIKTAGKDGRFEEIKKRPIRFLNAWTIQGAWVTFTILSVLTINCTPSGKALGPADFLGWGMWVLGFTVEVVADRQKSAFSRRKTGKWIDEGLWRYSRHPNYLGEILMWLGLFVVGMSIYQSSQWICALSPLFVTFLLCKVSGVPMLEARADEKWGHDSEYQRYKKTVSVLLLMPRRTPDGGADKATSLLAPEEKDLLPEDKP